MQVESVPVSTPVSESSVPLPAAPPTLETSETTNTPLPPASEDVEQPTFHVMQPPPPAPVAPSEPTVAPPSTTYAQLIAVPIAPDQPIAASNPAPTVKQTKRGSRISQNKQVNRSPAKQATLLARPSITKPSTILPQPQKPVLLGNQMTPLIPKPVSTNNQPTKTSTNNQTPGFTTYLVVDGNQGQLVQVPNDGQKPVTFRNQAGQILQATPITVVSTGNQPATTSFPTNGDTSTLSNSSQINTFQQQTAVTSLATQQSHQNSSQTVTTVHTSSSFDMQRTTLTSDTTTMTTQQLTGISQLPATTSLLNGCNIITHQPSLLQPNPIIPTSIRNGNSLSTHQRDISPIHNDNDSSLDDTFGLDASNTTAGGDLSLSISQLAHKASHRHRRSSSSSLSKKKRGRPRLYERDPFTNKPIKSRIMPESTEVTIPNLATTTATTTLLMPSQTSTTTFNNIHPHTNGCTSLIFPNQPINHTTTIPVNNPSLLQQQQHQQQQQQQYSYPSLLNGNASSTNMMTAPTLNIFSNNNNITSSTNSYSYPSQQTTILPPPVAPSTNVSSRLFAPPITHNVENQATIPLKNLQISSTSSPMTSSPRPSTTTSSTTVPNVVQLNPSPKKSSPQIQNNDVIVHYIGGFVIRESSQPFPLDDNEDNLKDLNISNGKEKENSFNDNDSDLGSDQLRCILCKKVEFSERFFNQDKKICSKSCSVKSSKLIKTTNGKKPHYDKTPPVTEPIKSIENPLVQQSIQSHNDDQMTTLPPDHGLPADPSKWTVYQVGEFIARLTNDTIREAFYESEMDGQALLLMTQEHLRDTMKIKLGPSLIISSEITKLRERVKKFPC